MLLSQALYHNPIYCINNGVRCAKYKEEIYLHRQDVGFLLDITKPYKNTKIVRWDTFYPIFEKSYPNSKLELIGFDSGIGSNLKASEIEAKIPEYIHIKIILRMVFRMKSERSNQIKDSVIDYLIASYLNNDKTYRMNDQLMNTIYTTHYSFYPEYIDNINKTILNSAIDLLMRNMQYLDPNIDLGTVWWKVIHTIINDDILEEDFQTLVEETVKPLKKSNVVGGLFKSSRTEKALIERSKKPTLKHYIDYICDNPEYLGITMSVIYDLLYKTKKKIQKYQPSNLFVYRISGTARIEALEDHNTISEEICLYGDPYRQINVFGKPYTELSIATEINNFPHYRYFNDDESKYRYSTLFGKKIKVYNKEFVIDKIPVHYSIL